ncbi:MAG: LysR family transcriptional regulator [Pseudomonadota bacterium]
MPSEDSESRSSRPSLRELEVLHALIATGKTTAAGQRLGISQPAVSRAVAALEERVGRVLFSREGGRLVPTADALALEAEAAPILAGLARLENWPRAPRTQSVLRVSAAPTVAHYFLAPILARFVAVEPETRVVVEIGRGGDVLAAVAAGDVDVGIGMLETPVSHLGVRAEPFRRSKAACIMWPGHRLAELSVVRPADIGSEEPFIVVTRRFAARALLDRAFADVGIEPRIVAEATTSTFVMEMVRCRAGISVLNPFPMSLSDDASVVYRPFLPEITYEMAFLLPATGAAPPAARRFVDFVRAEQPDDPFTVAVR